jgi:hypothetical protein
MLQKEYDNEQLKIIITFVCEALLLCLTRFNSIKYDRKSWPYSCGR